MTVLRELVTMLGFEVEDEELQSWGDKAKTLAQDVGAAMVTFGAVAVGATVAVTQALIEMGDELGDASARLSVSAQDLAEWDHVATMSGASTEALRGALGRMPRIIDQVASGNRVMRSTFGELGVSVRGADGQLRSAGDVMQDVVGGLSRVTNTTRRAALANRIFGRGGQQLTGILAQGEEGVSRLRGEVRDLYGGDLPGFVAAAGRADDAQNRMNLQVRALGVTLGARVLPMVANFLEKTVAIGREFVRFVQGSSVVRAGLIAIALGAGIAAAAFVALNWEMLVAMAPVVLALGIIAGAVIGIALAVDDLWTMLDGGKSLFGETLGDLLGAEQAQVLIAGLQALWRQFQDDIEALTGGSIPGVGEAVRMLAQFWILQMGAMLLAVGAVVGTMVHSAREIYDNWVSIGFSIASIWNSGLSLFETYRSRILAGIEQIRSAVKTVSGFFGVSMSGGGTSASSITASPAARAVVSSVTNPSSSRSITVGDIIVQGVSDPDAAAEAVRARFMSIIAGEVDTARDGLVPEAP